jgi:hypothetical protein
VQEHQAGEPAAGAAQRIGGDVQESRDAPAARAGEADPVHRDRAVDARHRVAQVERGGAVVGEEVQRRRACRRRRGGPGAHRGRRRLGAGGRRRAGERRDGGKRDRDARARRARVHGVGGLGSAGV